MAIEFKIQTQEITLPIAGEERVCVVKPVSAYLKAEYQARLIDTSTATIGAIQSGDTKINIKALADKDLYLLAWTIISIAGEERWDRWDEKQRMSWLKQWSEALPAEFNQAVETIRKTCGDLI